MQIGIHPLAGKDYSLLNVTQEHDNTDALLDGGTLKSHQARCSIELATYASQEAWTEVVEACVSRRDLSI